jgi:hypothetical protein
MNAKLEIIVEKTNVIDTINFTQSSFNGSIIETE